MILKILGEMMKSAYWIVTRKREKKMITQKKMTTFWKAIRSDKEKNFFSVNVTYQLVIY